MTRNEWDDVDCAGEPSREQSEGDIEKAIGERATRQQSGPETQAERLEWLGWLRRRNELRATEADTGGDVLFEQEWRELSGEGLRLNIPDDHGAPGAR